MTTHLGSFFKDRRLELGWSLQQVAQFLGYKNQRKGANKIRWFECSGSTKVETILLLMDLYQIEPSTVEDLAAQDRKGLV